MNYYNDNDPKACAWLAELMAEGLIPKGEIDERSIVDVRAGDLCGFRQCHFFAGIGGWPYALRLAGWPEDREVWTGSCPCQPLSCAGKGKGHADERHLWPAFYRLISECPPAIVFGEQVAGKAGREWFAGVRADLEGMGYAGGGADLCSAGVGAPNIRQRLYRCGLDNSPSARSESAQSEPESDSRDEATGHSEQCQQNGGMGDTESRHRQISERPECQNLSESGGPSGSSFWSSSIWWQCRDGKQRRIPRIKSLLFRLSHGVPPNLDGLGPESGFPLCQKIEGRVALLKGYGNSINPWVAKEFIQAVMECV